MFIPRMPGKSQSIYLISVPANTRHWFDMGSNPNFKCIRLFTTADGWVGNFTGSEIAKTFPDFDTFLASA